MADTELDESVVAPHGRDEEGVPLAPFGHKANGDPRLSNRGRQPANAGPKVASPQRKASSSGPKAPSASTAKKPRTAKQTKSELLGLADMVIAPLAMAGMSPAVRKRVGDRQGDALAGDAVILHAAAPALVDGVMAYAERRPGLLAWMDKAEEFAPAVMMGQEIAKLLGAIAKNHMSPDPRLTAGARSLVNVQALQHAKALAEMEAELLAEAQATAEMVQERHQALMDLQAAPDLQVV